MAETDKAIMTLGAYQAATGDVVNWVKEYVADAIADQPTPVDPSMAAVIQALDQLNGEVIGTTASQKVSASLNYKNQMKTIFDGLGFVNTNVFRLYPSFLSQASGASGVYIEDTTGALWTADNWTALHTTEVASSIVIITSSIQFRMALTVYSGKNNGTIIQWYGLPNVSNAADTFLETQSAIDQTKAIICNYAPAELGKTNGVYSKATLLANLPSTCHYYETLAELQATTGNEWHLYIVNNGGTTDGSGMHTYYWSGSNYVDLGAKPVNIPSNQYGFWLCWVYKSYSGDTRQWYEPNMLMLRTIYNNKTAVQKCYKAINGTNFSEGNTWSCQQQRSTYGWYFILTNDNAGNGLKSTTNFLVPCAAY